MYVYCGDVGPVLTGPSLRIEREERVDHVGEVAARHSRGIEDGRERAFQAGAPSGGEADPARAVDVPGVDRHERRVDGVGAEGTDGIPVCRRRGLPAGDVFYAQHAPDVTAQSASGEKPVGCVGAAVREGVDLDAGVGQGSEGGFGVAMGRELIEGIEDGLALRGGGIAGDCGDGRLGEVREWLVGAGGCVREAVA